MSDKLQKVERELSVADEGALEKALDGDLEVRVHECGCTWDIMDKGITITMRCAEHARGIVLTTADTAKVSEAIARDVFKIIGRGGVTTSMTFDSPRRFPSPESGEVVWRTQAFINEVDSRQLNMKNSAKLISFALSAGMDTSKARSLIDAFKMMFPEAGNYFFREMTAKEWRENERESWVRALNEIQGAKGNGGDK